MPEIVSPGLVFLMWGALAYLIGSIPFGLVVARVMGLGNLREIGSGNIGATNVLRTGSKKAAASTLALDMGKGFAAVWLALAFAAPDAGQLAGLAVMIGHCFPVWLRFRGGKGVATFFGVVFALVWPIGLIAALVWIATAALLRFSSLAALLAAGAAVLAAVIGPPHWLHYTVLFGIICALIFWRHRDNIKRLVAGNENKIGKKG